METFQCEALSRTLTVEVLKVKKLQPRHCWLSQEKSFSLVKIPRRQDDIEENAADLSVVILPELVHSGVRTATGSHYSKLNASESGFQVIEQMTLRQKV